MIYENLRQISLLLQFKILNSDKYFLLYFSKQFFILLFVYLLCNSIIKLENIQDTNTKFSKILDEAS